MFMKIEIIAFSKACRVKERITETFLVKPDYSLGILPV